MDRRATAHAEHLDLRQLASPALAEWCRDDDLLDERIPQLPIASPHKTPCVANVDFAGAIELAMLAAPTTLPRLTIMSSKITATLS